MNKFEKEGPSARRTMVLFFVFDTSYSMEGSKIASLNQAMRDVMPIISDISINNADAEIKIAALKFSSGCEWMFDEPKVADEFAWMDKVPDGATDLGAACIELNTKLSRKEFLSDISGSYAPVVLLLSDGEPNDDFDGGLLKLQSNNWFKHALKFAIAIGNDADKNILSQFTGSRESVIEVHNVDALKTMIRVVSVTASQIGSQSKTSSNKGKQELVNEAIKEEVNSTEGAQAADAADIEIDDDFD